MNQMSFARLSPVASLAYLLLLCLWSTTGILAVHAELVPIYLEQSPSEAASAAAYSCNAMKAEHVREFDYQTMCVNDNNINQEGSDTGMYTVLEGVACLAVSGVEDSTISISVEHMDSLPVCEDPAAIHVAQQAYYGTLDDICQSIDAQSHLANTATHLMVRGVDCFFSPESPCHNPDVFVRAQRLDRFNACDARLAENTAYVLVEDVVCGIHQNGMDMMSGTCVDGNAYRIYGSQTTVQVKKMRHHGVRYAGIDEDDVSPILYNLGISGFAVGVELLQTKTSVHVYHVSATGNYRGATPVESRGIQLLCSQFNDNVRSGIASFESDVQVVDTQTHSNGRFGLEGSMSTIAHLGLSSTHEADVDRGTFFMEMRQRGESLRECYDGTPGLILQRA